MLKEKKNYSAEGKARGKRKEVAESIVNTATELMIMPELLGEMIPK